MKPEFRAHKFVFLGCIISILLLAALGALRVNYPTFTSLEAHWVALGLLPLLLFMFLGGLIRSIGIGGAQFEGALAHPIVDYKNDLTVNEMSKFAVSEIGQLDKGTLRKLNNLPVSRKLKIQFLTLQMTPGHQSYEEFALLQYFKALPRLRFLEFIDQRGEFVGYLPIEFVDIADPDEYHADPYARRHTQLISLQEIVEFCGSSELTSGIVEKLVRLEVDAESTVGELLNTIEKNELRVIALISGGGNYIGPLFPARVVAFLAGSIDQR